MPNELERGCLIPLAQSFITGVFVALIAGGIAVWMKWDALPIALITGACAALLWWYGSLQLWRNDVYQPLPGLAEPVQSTTPQITPITIHMDRQISMVDLPASPAQLRDLSAGLLAGMSFSEASWSGEGRPFSRDQFRKLRDVYLQKGWIAWANPKSKNQGVSLTRSGAAV